MFPCWYCRMLVQHLHHDRLYSPGSVDTASPPLASELFAIHCGASGGLRAITAIVLFCTLLMGGFASRSDRDAGPTRGAGRSNGGGPYAQRRGAPGVALRRRGNWGGTRVDLSQPSKGSPVDSRGAQAWLGQQRPRVEPWAVFRTLLTGERLRHLAHEVRRGCRVGTATVLVEPQIGCVVDWL